MLLAVHVNAHLALSTRWEHQAHTAAILLLLQRQQGQTAQTMLRAHLRHHHNTARLHPVSTLASKRAFILAGLIDVISPAIFFIRPAMKTFLALILFLILTPFFQSSLYAQEMVCKKTVCFESSQIITSKKIPIHGVDLLEYVKLDLYTAALYAPAEIKTIDGILGEIPKSLVLHYHRTIKKELMIKASRDRIKKNPDNNSVALEGRLLQLDKAYQTVQKGDRYELRYEPGIGTSLILNGKLQATIQGEDFQRAFFGIWLSRLPLNKKLRDHLIRSSAEK